MDIRLGGTFYRLGKKIGSGAYGDVHVASKLRTGEEVAIKLEPVRRRAQQLVYEAMLYHVFTGAPGVAKVHWYGVVGDLNVMVMDLLGPSLEDLLVTRRAQGHKGLDLRRVAALGEQMLDRVEHMHSKGYVHRDIKPENFMLGLSRKSSTVHVIDFGLAKKYIDPKTRRHVPFQAGGISSGNIAFSSLAALNGFEQSRRDDLEAVVHVLVYMLRGKLPWLSPADSAEMPAACNQLDGAAWQKTREERAVALKRSTSVEALCKKCPQEFVAFMKYCRNLQFEENPDYGYLRALLRSAIGNPSNVSAVQEGEEVNTEWWLADDAKSKVTVFASTFASMRKQEWLTGRRRPSAKRDGMCTGGQTAADGGRALPALLGTVRGPSDVQASPSGSSTFDSLPATADDLEDSLAGNLVLEEANPAFELLDRSTAEADGNPVFEARANPVVAFEVPRRSQTCGAAATTKLWL